MPQAKGEPGTFHLGQLTKALVMFVLNASHHCITEFSPGILSAAVEAGVNEVSGTCYHLISQESGGPAEGSIARVMALQDGGGSYFKGLRSVETMLYSFQIGAKNRESYVALK